MLAGEKVQAKIFYDHVEFYHDHRPVGRFPRSYKTNDEVYDWTQYVSTLCKKPCNFSAKSLLTETLSSVMMLWKWQPPMAGPMWTACGSVIT